MEQFVWMRGDPGFGDERACVREVSVRVMPVFNVILGLHEPRRRCRASMTFDLPQDLWPCSSSSYAFPFLVCSFVNTLDLHSFSRNEITTKVKTIGGPEQQLQMNMRCWMLMLWYLFFGDVKCSRARRSTPFLDKWKMKLRQFWIFTIRDVTANSQFLIKFRFTRHQNRECSLFTPFANTFNRVGARTRDKCFVWNFLYDSIWSIFTVVEAYSSNPFKHKKWNIQISLCNNDRIESPKQHQYTAHRGPIEKIPQSKLCAV